MSLMRIGLWPKRLLLWRFKMRRTLIPLQSNNLLLFISNNKWRSALRMKQSQIDKTELNKTSTHKLKLIRGFSGEKSILNTKGYCIAIGISLPTTVTNSWVDSAAGASIFILSTKDIAEWSEENELGAGVEEAAASVNFEDSTWRFSGKLVAWLRKLDVCVGVLLSKWLSCY